MANPNDGNRSNQQGGQQGAKPNEPTQKQAGDDATKQGRQAGAKDIETGREARLGGDQEANPQRGDQSQTQGGQRGMEPDRGGQSGQGSQGKA